MMNIRAIPILLSVLAWTEAANTTLFSSPRAMLSSSASKLHEKTLVEQFFRQLNEDSSSVGIDPLFIKIEGLIYGDFCSTPAVRAFIDACRELNQPTLYSACDDHGSEKLNGTIRFKPASPNQMCYFFVDNAQYDIKVNCRALDEYTTLQDHLTVYNAANLDESTALTPSNPSASYPNGVLIVFKDGDGRQKLECNWATEMKSSSK